jgi:hypothetical protein
VADNDQLRALVRPFPSKYIKANPSGGGTYVAHEVVTQRLLHVLGPFSTEVDQIIRGDVDALLPKPDGNTAKAKAGSPALTNVVVGVLLKLEVTIDGRLVTVTEVGDCEQPHNWPTDGARMKDAMSDAIKRCAMRLGCGLHLWAQDLFYLHAALAPEVKT